MKNCEDNLSAASKKLRAEILGEDDNDTIVNLPVSIDGSWHKRYGHNSSLGVEFAISIDSGQVLDYVVKSKFCFVSKK